MLAPDYSKIRGANYVPSYASTSVGIWKDFQADVIDRELGYAARLRLNSVRVFLQYVVYEANAGRFLEDLECFVKLCAKHDIRPMFVLFDSCFGDEPAMEKADSPTWVNNPGFSRIGEENWLRLEKYAGDIVMRYRGDPRVLMWDIMNEPMADFQHVTRKEREHIWSFCRHFCSFVRKADPTHPTTVGHALVEYIPRTMDLVDVISIHSYERFADWLRKDIALGRGYAQRVGKPAIITEFGNPGVGQKYEMALEVIESEKIGFYFWELMIAKVMFTRMSGLLYPDGTVREPEAIAALLGFRHNPEGIPLNRPPDDGTALRKIVEDSTKWKEHLDRARRVPRTAEGILPYIHGLGTLGRHLARPSPEAMKIVESGLSIPHLFRQGQAEEAVKLYDEMLRLVEAAVESRLRSEGKP